MLNQGNRKYFKKLFILFSRFSRHKQLVRSNCYEITPRKKMTVSRAGESVLPMFIIRAHTVYYQFRNLISWKPPSVEAFKNFILRFYNFQNASLHATDCVLVRVRVQVSRNISVVFSWTTGLGPIGPIKRPKKISSHLVGKTIVAFPRNYTGKRIRIRLIFACKYLSPIPASN